ncbi:hypothetical protein PMAYCL1PPCAC_21694, partial [Pristionchus mayeri]
IAIAVERIVSARNPEKYHSSPGAYWVLISHTLSAVRKVPFCDTRIFSDDQFVFAGTFVLTCDILTLLTNSRSVRFAEKSFNSAFENLNAKYQSKEALQMSVAMKPVYIAIFSVKCIIGTASIICLQSGNPYAIGYNDMCYSCVSTIYDIIIIYCRRFLFNAWLSGYLSLFMASIGLWVVCFYDEKGYLAQSTKSPPHRLFLYELCTTCSLFCTISEIAIAIERIVSTRNPEKYHNSPGTFILLIAHTVTAVRKAIIKDLNMHILQTINLYWAVLACDILTLLV